MEKHLCASSLDGFQHPRGERKEEAVQTVGFAAGEELGLTL